MHNSYLSHIYILVFRLLKKQKRGPVKKVTPTMQEVKEKICKLKVNKHRLELRKIQIASRALNIESKIKANEADLMKLSSVEEGIGTDSKDSKWPDTTKKHSVARRNIHILHHQLCAHIVLW